MPLLVCAILAACGGGGRNPASPDDPEDNSGAPDSLAAALVFADTSLAAAVRAAVSTSLAQPVDSVTAAQGAALTQLDASECGIVDLEGIQQLAGLTALTLADNQIQDATPLSGLPALQLLDLAGNQLADVSALAALTGLRALLLAGNQIADTAPLLALDSLETLDLTGNPVSTEQVAALTARGVEVAWEPPATEPVVPGDGSGTGPVVGMGPCLAFDGQHGWYKGIYLLPAGSTEPYLVVDVDQSNTQPSWSPDGQRLAFVRKAQPGDPGDIYVLEAGTTAPRPLVEHAAADYSPAWSPDGHRLAFTSERDGPADIMVLDFTDGTVRNVTQSASEDDEAAWSPDGRWLAYHSLTHDDGCAIRVVEAAGGQPRVVTRGLRIAAAPTWSPDGTRIGFSGGDDWNWLDIHVVGVDGADLQRLTSDRFYWHPWWTAEADEVVCVSRAGAYRRILAVSPDGSQRELYAARGFDVSHPAWCPDAAAAFVRLPDLVPHFADPELERTVRGRSLVSPREPIPTSVLQSVSTLSNLHGVRSLAGAEALVNLTELDLDCSLPLVEVEGLWVPDTTVSWYRPYLLSHVRDLAPLASCTRMRKLLLRLNPVGDLGPLAGMVELSWLSLHSDDITDLAPLAHLRRLERLSLGGARIQDVAPLSSLDAVIEMHVTCTSVSDVTGIGSMAALTTLDLAHGQVVDVRPLAGLAKLQSLDLSDNQVQDIGPLLALPRLRWLGLKGNPLSGASLREHVPALAGRGCSVVLDR